jgi:hypothetical protein
MPYELWLRFDDPARVIVIDAFRICLAKSASWVI